MGERRLAHGRHVLWADILGVLHHELGYAPRCELERGCLDAGVSVDASHAAKDGKCALGRGWLGRAEVRRAGWEKLAVGGLHLAPDPHESAAPDDLLALAPECVEVAELWPHRPAVDVEAGDEAAPSPPVGVELVDGISRDVLGVADSRRLSHPLDVLGAGTDGVGRVVLLEHHGDRIGPRSSTLPSVDDRLALRASSLLRQARSCRHHRRRGRVEELRPLPRRHRRGGRAWR